MSEVAKASSSGTVTVACKIPAGLVLSLDRMVEGQEPVMGGGWKTVKRAEPIGEPVRLLGPRKLVGELQRNLVAGYALTYGVSREFWDAWYAANRETDLVRNRMVFAHERNTEALAKEHRKALSNLEPLTTAQRTEGDRKVPVDPRWPRRPAGSTLGELESDPDSDNTKRAA